MSEKDHVSLKISWKLSLSLISIAPLSHVYVFLLKIVKMCGLYILGQTLGNYLVKYTGAVRCGPWAFCLKRSVDLRCVNVNFYPLKLHKYYYSSDSIRLRNGLDI